MKGLPGLAIAVALGVVGAACNWFYVHKQASGYERVAFVGIKPTAQINFGDPFREDHFVPVPVPRQYMGNLDKTAVRWEEMKAVVENHAKRNYIGGELLLHQDLVAPPVRHMEDLLAEDEVAFPVVVDSRVFVSENFNPGDRVSFFVSHFMSVDEPTPADSGTVVPTRENLIGPFRILRLGSRAGSHQVEQAHGRRATREDVIWIPLKINDVPDKGARLVSMSRQGLYVVKHSAESRSSSR